ncbi:MAG: alkaline phosphatase family protein [Anaerolineae bacterium]
MTWFLRKLVDFFSLLANWYYAKKYGALASHIGRGPEEPTPGRGQIVVQIDGLSYPHLRVALKRGYCPTLQRMLARRQARLRRWRCGLPSTTLASQAGIMYGANDDIPAFRWFDKETRTAHSCKVPQSLRLVQERIAQGRVPLLEGGSSYGNLLDGGARLALFTLGALNGHRFFENVRGLSFLILFLLSPLQVLRVLVGCLWEYLRDLVEGLATWVSNLGQGRPKLPSPILQILADLVVREIQTYGVMMDIYRGVPYIYVNYFGFDEVAHCVGPTHPKALRVLRGLDNRIHQIDRIRRTYRRREYDLFVLSDHGISPSVPFQERDGRTLGTFIAEQVERPVALDERLETDGWGQLEAAFLLRELDAVEKRTSSPAVARLLRRGRDYMHQRWPLDGEEWELDRHNDVVVRGSGNLMHVYFNVHRSRLHLSEIALLYPKLLQNLLHHPDIGLVVGQEGNDVVILGKGGSVRIGRGSRMARGKYPLEGLREPEQAEQDLLRLVGFRTSGDLIVIGAWDKEGRVVSFEVQRACHGGLGGPQDDPFLLFPSDGPAPPFPITSGCQLYTYFMQARQWAGEHRQEETVAVRQGVAEDALLGTRVGADKGDFVEINACPTPRGRRMT